MPRKRLAQADALAARLEAAGTAVTRGPRRLAEERHVADLIAFRDPQGTALEAFHGAALADAETATTVRHTDGQVSVTDGPFVELTEQVAGFYLVDLPDLDAAIEAASLLPCSYTVEIRPVVDIEGYELP